LQERSTGLCPLSHECSSYAHYSNKTLSNYRPGHSLGLQEVEVLRVYRQSAHEGGKVVSPTHRPPDTPMRYPWYSFLLETGSSPGPYAAGWIKSVKNSSGFIGNRTCDLLACSAVPLHALFPQLRSMLLHVYRSVKCCCISRFFD
jgi:hypothetical protein